MGVIRLILALSVLASHAGVLFNLEFVGGQIAVQAFYIISGFYMSLILNEKYIGQNGNYKLFISNRFLRLYPIYWAVLGLSILFCFLNGLLSSDANFFCIDFYVKYYKSVSTMLVLLFSQLLIIGQDVLMFFGFNPNTMTMYYTSNYALEPISMHRFLFIPQAWTLGIEICFYLIAPFILRRNWKWILSLLLLSFGIKMYIHFGLNLTNDPWSYRFFPSELMFFLIGYFCYKMANKIKTINVPEYANLSIFVFLVLFTLFYFKIPSFGYPLFLFELLYFIVFVFSLPFLFVYFKNKKWDTQIGDLSYPVYISHMLIILLYSACGFQYSSQGPYIALWCIVFSILLNKFISNPIEKLRQSRLKS